MGNTAYKEEQLAAYRPHINNYSLIYSASPLSIHRHNKTGEEIMQYRETVHNQKNVNRKLQTFYARYQHPYLVATQYVVVQGAQNCTEEIYYFKVYYERAVTNLSKVNDIPFNDSLHCYMVALKGFELLYKSYGYFEIFQSMFHICQKGKLKIWCNQNIYKTVPEQYLLGEGRQEDMVIKIISIIDNNTDKSTQHFDIKGALMRQNRLTFANAIITFKNICRDRRFIISQYLQSLQNASHVESMLDIYVPQETKTMATAYDTGLTFNPNKNNNKSLNTPITTCPSNDKRTSTPSKKTFRIFPNQRPYSMDNSRTSARSKPKVNLTLGGRTKQDGFPQFSTRNRRGSMDTNRTRQVNYSPSKRVSFDTALPKVEAPNLSSFHNNAQRQSILKKRGPKQIPRYPDKVFCQSQVHRIQGFPERSMKKSGLKREEIKFSPSSPSRSDYNQGLAINVRQVSGRQNSPVQSHTSTQGLTRSRSENNIQQHQERVVYSQPKAVQTVVSQYYQVPHSNHQQNVVRGPHSPKIVFTTSQPSNIKKSSRIIQFAQPQPVPNSYHQVPQPYQQVSTPQVLYPNLEKKLIQSKYEPANPTIYVDQRQNYHIEANKNIQIRKYSQPHRHNDAYAPFQRIESMNYNVQAKKMKQNDMFNVERKEVHITQSTHSTSSKPQEKLVTLRQNNAQKNKESKPDVLPELESKIFMLDSFASNKIMTYEFLNNQSHALSNIKWEKNSNSGRDSVTSAFRNDLVNDLSPKNFEKKGQQSELKKSSKFKKESDYSNKFNYEFLQTDPSFLEMIRSTTAKYKKESNDESTYSKRMQKINESLIKKDEVKEDKYDISSYMYKFDKKESKYDVKKESSLNFYKDSSKANQNKNSINHSSVNSLLMTNAFKKKNIPSYEKNSAISEKWQEENICSTSHGSINGKVHLHNLDADILEDMAAYGLEYPRSKVK